MAWVEEDDGVIVALVEIDQVGSTDHELEDKFVSSRAQSSCQRLM